MALRNVVGTVRALKFSSIYGLVTVRPPGRDSLDQLLILWFEDQSRGPAALFTSQLSLALANDREVRLTYDDADSYIRTVEVRGAAAS